VVSRLQGPHNFGIKPVDDAVAGDLYQLDRSLLPGFKSDGGAGSNIQAVAAGWLSIEFERFIDFIEMKVRTDLDRAIACVRHINFQNRATNIELDLARFYKNFAGYHLRLVTKKRIRSADHTDYADFGFGLW
jgi:hypothetical protein